ncbi:hypothetical protein [Sulfitobacter sp. SK025]|uniref:hypothetical protein n=1 Tax=Sulfitobacter sp. SK025 TaxID=1389011 RepID=UPI000E0AE25C|nr:hypothetical protein [Sulfitobacter sp. SK025]AXI50386.1 hypothetical protein C1J04_05450 [Sulfitobacter sp. SK025]
MTHEEATAVKNQIRDAYAKLRAIGWLKEDFGPLPHLEPQEQQAKAVLASFDLYYLTGVSSLTDGMDMEPSDKLQPYQPARRQRDDGERACQRVAQLEKRVAGIEVDLVSLLRELAPSGGHEDRGEKIGEMHRQFEIPGTLSERQARVLRALLADFTQVYDLLVSQFQEEAS